MRNIIGKIIGLFASAWENLSFAILLMVTALYQIVTYILSAPLIIKSKRYDKVKNAVPVNINSRALNFATRIYLRIAKLLERRDKNTITRVDLMDISFKTIWIKRTRSIITMGSIALAISFIVFLLSIGFGLQQVVISRAVKLNEMQQADVSPGYSDDLQLNEETLATLLQLDGVKSVFPVISSVGRVEYEQSSFDVATYGVTTGYLEESSISPTRGRVFESYSYFNTEDQESGNVKGIESTGSLDIVNIDEGDSSDPDSDDQIQLKPITSNTPREIVVNRAFLTLMGVSEDNAINQNITLQLIVMSDLLTDKSRALESIPEQYTIVGITPEQSEPTAYIPLVDIRSLGINRFSQIRVVVESQEQLAGTRLAIETLGFSTTSVADTVSQIESFFASLRVILAIFGVVALAVASLGMFNTLTISLLERTHEVGLLKALGMSAVEVREIFLSESMIMGFFGGIIGLIFGIISANFLGFVLSTVSISRGGDTIDISSTPLVLVIVVIVISLLIGLVTGWYPARRAMSISALNALRYE